MKIILGENNYEVIKNYKDAFNNEDLNSRFEEYFLKYDFILGDYAYGKLRLKGFYNKDNKEVSDLNNIEYIDKYLTDYCAFDCKHFVIAKKWLLLKVKNDTIKLIYSKGSGHVCKGNKWY